MILAVLIAVTQAPPAVPECLRDGATRVTLTGTIGVATDVGDPVHGKAGYRYATLTLDTPACLRNSSTGKITTVRAVRLVSTPPNQTLPFRFKGVHSQVTGQRVVVARSRSAPLLVTLLSPMILPDGD